MVNMTPAEFVAQRTWNILGRAKKLHARFGEESLTDLLVLDMLTHPRARAFWLWQTNRQEEASCGADLLVAVRRLTGNWSIFVLQAKKLYPDDKYPMLNGGRKCVDQLDKLERCARQLGAQPLYLLYNHTNNVQPSQHWHCIQPFTVEQLGCTLVPSWRIRQMIYGPPPQTFDKAHRVSRSMLWRCAFDCPDAEELLMRLACRTSPRDPARPPDQDDIGTPAYDWSFEPRETAWPERLLRESPTELTLEDFDRIRRELFDPDEAETTGKPRGATSLDESPSYPARLLIVDQREEPSVRPQEAQDS